MGHDHLDHEFHLMDQDLRALFTETVTVYAWAADTVYGAPSYSTSGTAYPARLDRRNRLVAGKDGRQLVATTTVYLAPTSTGGLPSLTARDRLVWSASTGEPLELLSWEKLYDEAGSAHHVAAYCG